MRLATLLLVATLGGCTETGAAIDGGLVAADVPEPLRDAGVDATTHADAGPARPPFLRDDEGGALILRGTNIEGAAKTAIDRLPRQRQPDFLRLREELGLDAIRLLVFWEAIEPTQGEYDADYLGSIATIAREASEAGLWVVIDMHQDVFGAGFGFTGAPRWACDEALYASFEPPPGIWALGYGEPETQACFDRLYTDPATVEAFANAWARLARELRDVSGVLAYEILNEPSHGSVSPRSFEQTRAPAFYEAVTDAIRAEDARPFVFFAPASPSNLGIPTHIVPPARERTIYAPHLYTAALELGGGYDGNPSGIERQLGILEGDAIERERPFVVTELGARLDLPGAAAYLRDVFDAFDRAQASAFQWEIRGGYDLVDDTGAPTALGHALARPYPARTAGTPIAYSWDTATQTFEFTWDEDEVAATGETVVMTPRLAFPRGYDAHLDDPGMVVSEASTLRMPRTGGRRRLVVQARP